MAAKSNYNAQSIPVDDVFIIGNRRAVDDEAVKALVGSIQSIGLQTPITVRVKEDVFDQESGEVLTSAYALVVGQHRLEACRRLGWKDIPAIVRECDEIEAELIEISENLHRADLTKEQRDRHIRRYAELLSMREAAGHDKLSEPAVDSRGQRKSPQQLPGIASKISADTGLSTRTVQRILAPPKPAPERASTTVINVPDPLDSGDATAKQVSKLMSAWNAAGEDARDEFLRRIGYANAA